MTKSLSKNRKKILDIIDKDKVYTIEEAVSTLKKIKVTKFDPSVDFHIRLNVNPKKSEQMVRGVVTLPNGTGKKTKILVLCTPDKEKEAKDAGADFVGLDDYIEKIKNGWTDIDVVITTPTTMSKVGPIGRILGPRGLMPNPKSGTVTMNVGKAVNEVKKGKVDFKVDQYGIIHSPIGKISFSINKIVENAKEIFNIIVKLKPPTVKGNYIKSIYLSSTMSPGLCIEPKSL